MGDAHSSADSHRRDMPAQSARCCDQVVETFLHSIRTRARALEKHCK